MRSLQYMLSGASGIRAEYTYLDLPEDIGSRNVFSVPSVLELKISRS